MTQQLNISEQMYRSLLASEKLPVSELKSYCDQQRLRTLEHAASTAPFYSKRLKAFRGSPSRIDVEVWNDIPVLTREDILNKLDDIVSTNVPEGHGKQIFGGTSGTSGMSILTKSTMMVGLMQGALQDRFYSRMRFDGKRKLVSIKGEQFGDYPDGYVSTEPWLPDYVAQRNSAPSVQLRQPVTLEKQLEFLNRQGPCYLNTQPSNLGGLALEKRSRPDRYPDIDVAGVICLGELVQPYHRELAKTSFGGEIFDIYSASEVGSIAHQCAAGHLHVNSEAVYVETLRDDGSVCDEDETGWIVITSTVNWAMLLIRYNIGDQGALSTGCSCGSSLPVLKMTVGRERNLFRFSDGTSVLGLVSLARYHEFFPVQQWQIAQTGPEELTVRFVCNLTDGNLNFSRLTSELQQAFDRPLTIVFDRRNKMSLTASGKLQEAVRED